jgi:hypothetical protein
MKIKYLLNYTVICVLPLFLIFSCKGLISNDIETGTLSLSFEVAQGKTIIPQIPITSYVITFSNGPVTQNPISTTHTVPIIELVIGAWNISVEGKDSEGITIAAGSAGDINIEAGEINSSRITLDPLNTGQGDIDITIMWPAAVSIDTVNAAIDGTIIEPTSLILDANSVQYLDEVHAGYYRIVFDLKDGTVLKTRIEEVVHVYGNLISTAVINLTESDFTAAPEAPTGLTVAESEDGIDLTWTDNSHVEISYIVERSEDGTNFTNLISSLPANTLSYSDTSVDTGVLYYYRIKANNFQGDSLKSNTESTLYHEKQFVSGLIDTNTTWTNNAVYNVTGNILVANGSTLTIESGTTVRFDGNFYIWIQGELIARGAENEKIVFTSNMVSPMQGDWGYIKFFDEAIDAILDSNNDYVSGSILEHCVVEYGKEIQIEDSFVYISHLDLRNCNPTINEHVLWMSYSSVFTTEKQVIKDSIISDNNWDGIYYSSIGGGGIVLIQNCTISNNAGSGIRVVSGESAISSNTIIDNSGNGIYISSSDSTITDNVVNNNNTGIRISSSSGKIAGNTISKNSGDGINIETSTLTIRENHVTENSTENGAGLYINAGVAEIHNNTFTDNIGSNAIFFENQQDTTFIANSLNNPVCAYEISINIPNTFDASRNYWGTSDTTEISSRIYDYYDDFSLGRVVFEPILNQEVTQDTILIDLLSPDDGGLSIKPNLLKWQTWGDAVYYHLVVTDYLNASVLDNSLLTDPFYSLSEFDFGSDYKWKVSGISETGYENSFSEERSFDIVDYWAIAYGIGDYDYLYDIHQSSNGSLLFSGSTGETGGGDETVWIMKISSDGEIIWQKTYRNGYPDQANSIIETSDSGIILTGGTDLMAGGDVWVIKLDGNGSIEWENKYGSSGFDNPEEGVDIIETINGKFILIGNRDEMPWIVCLNNDGTVFWQKTFAGDNQIILRAITEVGNDYVVIGDVNTISNQRQIWILKIDSNGSIIWEKEIGGTGNEFVQSSSTDSENNLIIAAHTNSFGAGEDDVWLIKIDVNGDILWQKTYGGTSYEEKPQIISTSNNDFIIAAEARSFGDNQLWAFKITSEGNVIWQKAYTISHVIYNLQGISLSADNKIVLLAATDSIVLQEPGTYNAVLLIKLNADGTYPSLDLDTNAVITNTSTSATSTNVNVTDTSVIPVSTSAQVADTDAIWVQIAP